MGDDQVQECSRRKGENNVSPSSKYMPDTPTHTGEKPFTMHTIENILSIHVDEKPDSSMYTGEKHSLLTHTNERPDSSLHVNDLAEELLLLIFSRFTPQVISTCIAPVCSKWHTLSRETILWKKLNFNSISTARAIRLFSTAPLKQLKSLEFGLDNKSSGDSLFSLISIHCPELVDLNLGGYSTLSVDSVRSLGKGCQKIEKLELNLYGGFKTEHEKRSIFEFFHKLRDWILILKKIDSDTLCLFDCTCCAQLVNVKLGVVKVTGTGRFISFLAKLQPFLWFLFVEGGESLTRNCYKAIGSCSKLTNVIIANLCELSDHNISCFGKLPFLVYFGLQYACSLTTMGLITAITAKYHFPALKELHLEGVDVVNDAVIIAIADRFPLLTRIDLRYVDVTDRGICRIIAKCSNLEALILHNLCDVSDICLWSIPKQLPRLRYLTICVCENISITYVDELKLARPDIQVKFST